MMCGIWGAKDLVGEQTREVIATISQRNGFIGGKKGHPGTCDDVTDRCVSMPSLKMVKELSCK